MLEPYERALLEAEPTISAAIVQNRLNVCQIRFTNKSLRTVQMAVKLGVRR